MELIQIKLKNTIKGNISGLSVLGVVFFFTACHFQSENVFLYQQVTLGDTSRYSVTKLKSGKEYELHQYDYELDVSFNRTDQSFTENVKMEMEDDTIFYKFYKLPHKAGDCYEYSIRMDATAENNITSPQIDYKVCYIQQLQDTFISGFFVNNCAVYSLTSETIDVSPLKLYWDEDRYVVVREESKSYTEQLLESRSGS